MYFVYILVCLQTKRSYVGQTDHLRRRFQRHREGSTRTTRDKFIQPVVVYFEVGPTRAEAMRRERDDKAGSGCRRKQVLIARRDQSLCLFRLAADPKLATAESVGYIAGVTVFSL